jgi:transposase
MDRPITPPQRHKSPPWPSHIRLQRDQRLQVKALHSAGYSQREIAKKLEMGRTQVRTAVYGSATPQYKRAGRPVIIDGDEKRRIIDWVCSSKQSRRALWEQITS